MSSSERQKLVAPVPQGRVLLHCCCAPCAGDVIETLLWSEVDHEVLFYNPNIHPHGEYLRRKDELQRFAARNGIGVVNADYDPAAWFRAVRGFETEPERGARCTVCFDVRLERTAAHAEQHGFAMIATSLGISRLKNIRQVDACGHRAAARHAGLIYWGHNWRKSGGADRAAELARQEQFYRQDYCGCVYSRSKLKLIS
ncbi:protein of unknown function DUF208 [Rhodopseudomonas palustris TIE-1]|uniref:epoxyqueuosine reductase QueH n=1 Tax=Rhodopseudomonas palustris TaxID=1076 RepID=UPI000164A606|nr:epoxyqueuosine reductase QueH [Rhodopseudomonas palustris]ACF01160.1 protein of unknown function DUF208 [Rhodopseudomonas palustris TIE-1]